MKKQWYSLALGLAAFTGCIELPILHEEDRKPTPNVERPHSAPITATEINDANAHAKADALQRELDDDEKAAALSPAKAEESKAPR